MKQPHTLSKKLVLFDIDGTLIRHFGGEPDINKGWYRFIHGLNTVFHINVVPKVDVNYHGSVDRAILFDIARQYGITKTTFDAKFEELKEAIIDYALTKETKQIYEAIPEAVELIHALRRKPKTFVLGILTGNVDAMAKWKLRHVGVDPEWFTIFITSDEFEDRITLAKSTFEKVEKNLGLSIAPHNTIVIGDAEGDVRCAKAIRAVSIIVLTGKHKRSAIEKESPDFVVDSLGDPVIREYFSV